MKHFCCAYDWYLNLKCFIKNPVTATPGDREQRRRIIFASSCMHIKQAQSPARRGDVSYSFQTWALPHVCPPLLYTP